MDTKVIFWIAITVVILLIIIAFWSERDMFFKKKEQKEKSSTEKINYNKVKELIKNIQLVVDFLEEFCESSQLNPNICRLLSDFLGEKINFVSDYRLSINVSEKLIDAQFLFRPGIFKSVCMYTLKNTINCLEN